MYTYGQHNAPSYFVFQGDMHFNQETLPIIHCKFYSMSNQSKCKRLTNTQSLFIVLDPFTFQGQRKFNLSVRTTYTPNLSCGNKNRSDMTYVIDDVKLRVGKEETSVFSKANLLGMTSKSRSLVSRHD